MNSKKNLDMTEGGPFRLLILFTLPALAGNLLNQVYSITDSIIVGRFLGETSLAAIGVCMPIVLLVGTLSFGLNIGVGILMSQCFGRRDIDGMRHILANSLYLCVMISAAALLIGYPLSEPILRLMGTPDGPLKEAVSYMHISFLSNIFPMLYYLFSNAFRGLGDAMTALYCLIVSVVMNILLDILFVAVLGWGVPGSAWATAIAQFSSVAFAVVMLNIKFREMRLTKKNLSLDLPLFKDIAVLAVPIAVQSAFNNLGNVVVQSCINGFGESVMAAYTAASRIGSLAYMPGENIGSTMSVYAGQNYGAGKNKRIPLGVRASHKLNLIVSVIIGAALILSGRWMIGLFLTQPSETVVSTAYRYLMIAAVPGIFNGIMCIYQQTLRGVGKATESVIGGFMQLGTKVAIAIIGSTLVVNLDLVWLAWPLSFIVGTIFPYIVYRRYDFKNN